VDKTSIDRIRGATFSVVRRGYDKREVDRFLSQVADWLETGAGDPTRAEIVKRELERVGDKTARILASAEESAEQLRSEAEAEAAETLERARAEASRLQAEAQQHMRSERESADSYAVQTREAAEQEARRVRLEGAQRAEEIVGGAERKAETLEAEGLRRRRDLETLIADLLERRDEVLDDLDRLADEVAGVVGSHTSGEAEPPAEEEAGLEEEQAAEEAELGEEAEYAEAGQLEGKLDEEEQGSRPTAPLPVERE
jgi:DivIVA domain-containing protein